MMSLPEEIAIFVDELVKLLDEEIELLETRCAQLAKLSKAMSRRDDETMETLLDDIEKTQELQIRTDSRLHAARHALAESFGWSLEQTRLAKLIEELPDQFASEVDYRRKRIVLLSDQLKRRHMETVVVVTECARVNRLLLESLFPQTQSVTTYGTQGKSSWQLDVGLVDVES